MRYTYHISLLDKPATESIAATKYFTVVMGIVYSCLRTNDSVTVWEFKHGDWVKYGDYTPNLINHVKELVLGKV